MTLFVTKIHISIDGDLKFQDHDKVLLTSRNGTLCRENPYVRCSCNNRQQINESEQNRKESIYGFRMQ